MKLCRNVARPGCGRAQVRRPARLAGLPREPVFRIADAPPNHGMFRFGCLMRGGMSPVSSCNKVHVFSKVCKPSCKTCEGEEWERWGGGCVFVQACVDESENKGRYCMDLAKWDWDSVTSRTLRTATRLHKHVQHAPECGCSRGDLAENLATPPLSESEGIDHMERPPADVSVDVRVKDRVHVAVWRDRIQNSLRNGKIK